ncbi:nucleotidyltransferase family protein [Halomonas ventosae]|uniref:nucleotidyltransferase family protein n=1 Tax=Halomonas ventosae TaxID=229007 RepID=UPI0014150676|nr:nucleotidyltransferase family protein [Halomonas ventosae]
MLLFSRLELDDDQTKAALALCDEVEDWEAFRSTARDRFILPVVYRHLRCLKPSSLPAEKLALMKQQVMALYRHNLNVIASLGEIHQQLLAPLEIPYVTFKGPSLAACYYAEPAMRFSRDIDILVPRETMAELLARALEVGYTPLDPPALTNDPSCLAFVARFHDVITVSSPAGVAVEFHARIDKSGWVYDSPSLIHRCEKTQVGNVNVSVLPTDELFVYICLHHTRHFWSRLHWLVDLDAIQRHPSFDRRRVLACAEQHGLSTTVDVCLQMAEVLGSPDFDPHVQHGVRVDKLLRLSLAAMQGNDEFERRLIDHRSSPDFAFRWQSSWGYRWRWLLMGWLRFFRPTFELYREWPLPSRWQWLYRPLRPWRAFRQRLLRHDTN